MRPLCSKETTANSKLTQNLLVQHILVQGQKEKTEVVPHHIVTKYIWIVWLSDILRVCTNPFWTICLFNYYFWNTTYTQTGCSLFRLWTKRQVSMLTQTLDVIFHGLTMSLRNIWFNVPKFHFAKMLIAGMHVNRHTHFLWFCFTHFCFAIAHKD